MKSKESCSFEQMGCFEPVEPTTEGRRAQKLFLGRRLLWLPPQRGLTQEVGIVAITLDSQASGWAVADLATGRAEVLAAARVRVTVARAEPGYRVRESGRSPYVRNGQ